MATPASHFIKDQDFYIRSNGAAKFEGKTGFTKADKKGVLGGRKALNDISNSSNFTRLQTKNDISKEKDLSFSKTKPVFGGKTAGRKALSNLTNSARPPSQSKAFPKKSLKINPVAEKNAPALIEEERFLHNHEKCIKAQRKAIAIDCNWHDFLKSQGADIDGCSSSPVASTMQKPESPVRHLEMQEIPEMLFEDRVAQSQKKGVPGYSSPSCSSPSKSPDLRGLTRWIYEELSEVPVLKPSPKAPELLNP